MVEFSEAVLMANAPLKKSLLNPLRAFEVISATLDTVTLNKDGIHSTVPTDRVMPVPYNAWNHGSVGRDSATQSDNYRRDEEGAHKNDTAEPGSAKGNA